MGGGSINKVVMDGFIKHRFQALQSPARNDMHYEACRAKKVKDSLLCCSSQPPMSFQGEVCAIGIYGRRFNKQSCYGRLHKA